MHNYGTHEFEWKGNSLHLLNSRKILTIEPDERYPQMWRVRLPDGRLTDMVNLTRARDAARMIAVGILNREQSAA